MWMHAQLAAPAMKKMVNKSYDSECSFNHGKLDDVYLDKRLKGYKE